MINIILAEDHNIVRNGLTSLLAAESDLQIVAEATNGREVLDALEKGMQADLLLTDLNMPVLGGLELTGIIKERYPGIRTIVLSALDSEKHVIEILKAGASGFLLKSITPHELLFAIRHVFNGNQYICSEMITKLFKRLSSIPEPACNETACDIVFSKREVEVLSLLAEGMTNQEIADKLFSSKRTIEGYRESMIGKTGVRNTAALIHFAVVNGLIN